MVTEYISIAYLHFIYIWNSKYWYSNDNVTQNGGAGSGDQENGWNLIGNPYPSTIDWNRLSVSDKNNIENSIWIFNQTAGNYGVWNGASGTLGVDNQIASLKHFGFMQQLVMVQLPLTKRIKSMMTKHSLEASKHRRLKNKFIWKY